MRGRSSKGSHITGRTGPSSEGETASTSGPTPQHWSSPTAPMAGSGSSWMGSWPPCTPAGVQKGARTAPVQETNSQHTQHTSPVFFVPLINLLFSSHLLLLLCLHAHALFFCLSSSPPPYSSSLFILAFLSFFISLPFLCLAFSFSRSPFLFLSSFLSPPPAPPFLSPILPSPLSLFSLILSSCFFSPLSCPLLPRFPSPPPPFSFRVPQ